MTPFPDHLQAWVEDSLARDDNILATSNQGTVLRYRDAERDWVIKAAMGGTALRKARQNTINREYRAYTRLAGIDGIPRCHGMLAGRFLVLDFMAGVPYRGYEFGDRERWFAALLETIRAIHARGVCHGDLKTKGNLMVTADERPCIIDFGTSFVRREGFHPVGNFLFEHFRQMDLNAWVKHKYHGQYANASAEDRDILKYSAIERFWRRFVHRLPKA